MFTLLTSKSHSAVAHNGSIAVGAVPSPAPFVIVGWPYSMTALFFRSMFIR